MNTMPSLYTISGDLLALLSAIEANEGEITPDIEQALAITEDQFAAKATDYGLAILNLEAMAKAAKAEKERLAGLQKFYENVAGRLRGALCGAMDVLDHPKVESPSVRLFLRHTTATEVDDVTKLPDEFVTTKIEDVPDKAAIKKALQEGRDVPGAHLVENVSLQIK